MLKPRMPALSLLATTAAFHEGVRISLYFGGTGAATQDTTVSYSDANLPALRPAPPDVQLPWAPSTRNWPAWAEATHPHNSSAWLTRVNVTWALPGRPVSPQGPTGLPKYGM